MTKLILALLLIQPSNEWELIRPENPFLPDFLNGAWDDTGDLCKNPDSLSRIEIDAQRIMFSHSTGQLLFIGSAYNPESNAIVARFRMSSQSAKKIWEANYSFNYRLDRIAELRFGWDGDDGSKGSRMLVRCL